MQLLESRLLLTPEGKEELAAEVACLEHIRRDLLAEGKNALDRGGCSTRNELAAVDGEISRLRRVLTCGVLVDDADTTVAVGSQVTVVGDQGEETFTISGPVAANPRLGRVSYESPLARALLGHVVGDEVELTSAEGRRRLRVVAIGRE